MSASPSRRYIVLPLAIAAMLSALFPLSGQTPPASAPARGAPPPASRPATSRPASAKPDRAALERELSERLRGAVLFGTWSMIDAKTGLLSQPQPDTYTITSFEKADGEFWIVTARIQYNQIDATVPLRIPIIWAGEVPMIAIDDLPIPGVGTYSARVLLHGNLYSGTWHGTGYGGVLSGQIMKEAEYRARVKPTSDGD